MEDDRRKDLKGNNPSQGRAASEANPNQSVQRRNRRPPSFPYIFLIVFLIPIFNLRKSISFVRTFDSVASLDEEVSLPRAERQGGRAADVRTGDDTPLKTLRDKVGKVTTAVNEVSRKDSGKIAEEETPRLDLSLASYSYNTTNVGEFNRLQHEYLLSRQELLNYSHLSTKAREKDAHGNPMTTFAFVGQKGFIAGFRNQIMSLTMLVLKANYGGHKQLLLESLRHKDTYGTNKHERFDFFFDVEHWNQYSYSEETIRDKGIPDNIANPERYPNWLPRMVLYDPSVHDDLKNTSVRYKSEEIAANATRPYGYQGRASKLAGMYIRYGKGKGSLVPHPIGTEKKHGVAARNPAEILMLQGALRPHPALQAVVDRSKKYLGEMAHRAGDLTNSSMAASARHPFRYMALHARVEPDMQKHVMCKDKKVLTLQEIVDMIESKWPEPPVDAVFLPINRQYLEKEGTLPKEYKNDTESNGKINWIAVRNLQLLNDLTNHNGPKNGTSVGGLWNGKVPVVEFGSEALHGTVYEHRPSTSGSILNYFLALDAHIFVGTEVSSFSHDVLGARFYRGFSDSDKNDNVQTFDGEKKNLRKNNFNYLPGGLQEWVTDDMLVPPNFDC